MKKRFSRSLVSMVLCFAMVVGICFVPASASARIVSDSARVWVNGTEIMVNNRDNGPGTFSRELVVIGYDPDAQYSGTKVYGPGVGSGETYKPGTYNAFPMNIPTTDQPMDLRIDFLDSNWETKQSITVRYDVTNDALTVLEPTSRTITVDQVNISFYNFSYYDEIFYGEMLVDATNNPAYEPYYIVAEFSPNLDSVGSMLRPGGPVATFSLSGRVGNVTNITYRITLYDHNYQNAIQVYATYDVTRNDFIHPFM
ncbi:hypothetical protein [Clostridium sp. D33t1_170424_F3]|uniref:hypothetical protein n=1 Tax=Clostridium sp. D33t1_170424_F3 TaxID=2787099 RepID=UPI0018AB10B0|nr:hypothetical protein [Clostridium sp. D33t1_170424_F3]